jgi:parallel beta-helix repeat protein
MRIPSALSLLLLLLTGVLSVNLIFPLLARAVECGDHLTSGGIFVLDSDLTCPDPDPDGDPYAAGLYLGSGTILDLNGYTISCTGGLNRAISMGHAQLRNGTIANCEEGIQVSNGVLVEQVVFTRNTQGVRVEGGEGNTFRDNTAVENVHGFVLTLGDDDSGSNDNLLVNNLAIRNSGIGFAIGGGRRNQLIGNTASLNAVGFGLASDDMSVSGNVAEANHGPGFRVFGSGNLVGNTAKGNEGEGFVTDSDRPLAVEGNVARENGRDGFLLPAAFVLHQRVLQRNVALNNKAHGIHVAGDDSPKSRMLDNTVLGHLSPYFDLADDNQGCLNSVWRRNTFDTASQACIR